MRSGGGGAGARRGAVAAPALALPFAVASWRSARRPNSMEVVWVMTSRPAWSRSDVAKATIPASGRQRASLLPTVVVLAVNRSPGRTGASQRLSSMLKPAMIELSPSQASIIIRVSAEQTCQPEAERPPKIESFAAVASRWKGCAS